MNNLPVVRSPWRIAILVIGFTFLYAPMLMLVIYSFNSSKLVTVWAGWSTRWYGELFHDDAMMSAVGLSLTIAALAATMASVLGTIAALVMVRFGRFRGSNGFAFMITAPLVMPDVITGLALLTAFKTIDLEPGFFTIVVGHATFCVVVVFNNVIARFRRTSWSLVEASMDLGADGWQTFRYVVLPNLGSALLAGGMLAFALSFDEIIVTTFTAGHERTLPLWLLNQLGRPRDVPVTNVVALLVMLVTTFPILGAWWLTRDGENIAGSGK